jgi:hypothetical protein
MRGGLIKIGKFNFFATKAFPKLQLLGNALFSAGLIIVRLLQNNMVEFNRRCLTMPPLICLPVGKSLNSVREPMNEIETIRLELRAPLFYREERDLVPWVPEEPGDPARPEAGERLFCFALDPVQGRSIEPDPARLLGPLVAAGRSVAGSAAGGLELPAGRYLFAQRREVLGPEAFVEMAVELQKDGLWERLELEDRLYLRRLFEDGKRVSQVFRPYRTS